MSYDVLTHTFTGQAAATVRCCVCSMEFVVPESFYHLRKNDGQDFWCPAGHEQHYTDSLKDRLAREQHRREQAEARVADLRKENEHIERRRRGTLGALRKTQKRVKHGVCPCCKRTFQQLAKHMATKHPTYAPHTEDAP